MTQMPQVPGAFSPVLPDTIAPDTPRAPTDMSWARLRREAESMLAREPTLAPMVVATILAQHSLEEAMAQRLATRIGGLLPADFLRSVFLEAYQEDAALSRSLRLDLAALMDPDPASEVALDAVLYFKGFHAVQTHRIVHRLWHGDRRDLALHIADRATEMFQVEIHPCVPLGDGLFVDHATGVFIGATAEVGDNVSMLQGVVLGSLEGQEIDGRRHPRIGHGVLIGAGAKILGPVTIGHCTRIGAGSVFTQSVPSNRTVVGVPARIVGHAGCAEPSRSMDQMVFDVGL
ncbi:serine O-acetyltransferase EpsC [uncultured Aureimonas sp.]|uniref:serine O-acetyltransferase EpsC n=1 Tax=uncultured Aureimonas sp. TaxID=1604662 RepID=UPI0025E6B313|nr:serine O-acetyltransferase EpsC [uncultured Aureimonas sp.]